MIELPYMSEQSIQGRITQELEKADRSRAEGNEGKARVCARRAVGIAIGEYFKSNGYPDSDRSVYNRLRELSELPTVSKQIHEIASHFLLRVTPEHDLPVEVDLIAEARWLITELLNDHPSLPRNTH